MKSHTPYSNLFRRRGRILMIAFALLMVIGTGVSAAQTETQKIRRTPVESRIWVVQVASGADAQAVAATAGMEYLAPVGSLSGYHLFRLSDANRRPGDVSSALIAGGQVVSFRQQFGYEVEFANLTTDDPDYPDSWHLENTGQDSHGSGPGIVDQDIDAQSAWDPDNNPETPGFSGTGVVMAAIDDGIEWSHPDLGHNYRQDLDYDYTDFDDDGAPVGEWGDAHGTSVSGIMGAGFNNGKCSTGIAYDADLVSIRLLGSTGDSGLVGYDGSTAASFSHRLDKIDVYNNSWGWLSVISFNNELPLAGKALETAVTTGRGGRGAIHVFAAGNDPFRSTNHDPNTSSRYTITVGGSNNFGQVVWYSTRGSGVFVSAPTLGGAYSGYDNGIYTTDMMGDYGYNYGLDANVSGGDLDCTSEFGGTSAAAPMVSGVVALMLEANPNLTWRDIKHIMAETSEKIDPAATGAEAYQTNAAGFDFSHAYGFGRVNAGAAVAAAAGWTNVPPEVTVAGDVVTVNQPLADGSATGVTSTYEVQAGDLPAGFVVEHVVVRIELPHTYPGDIYATLTSPSGVTSRLLQETYDGDGYEGMVNDFPLLTVANWGETTEDLEGTWTFNVSDRLAEDMGTLQEWQMVFYGYIDSTLSPATGLVASAASETSINLTWFDNASSETGYRVERTTDPNDAWTPLTDLGANVTNYTDTGLTTCTRYYYRVIAVQGVAETVPSNTANARPKGAGSCAVTQFTLLRPGPGFTYAVEPEVAFTNPSNLDQFQVKVFKPNGKLRFNLKVEAAELATYCTVSLCSVDLAALDPVLVLKNGSYKVQVTARYTDATKGKSQRHPFTIQSPGVPRLITPIDYATLDSPDDLSVFEWSHLELATSYRVKLFHGQRKVYTAKLDADDIATSCTAGKCTYTMPTTIQDQLENQRSYNWLVVAGSLRGKMESLSSNFYTEFLNPPGPIEPSYYQVYPDNKKVRFVWEKVEGAVEYKLVVQRYGRRGLKRVLKAIVNSTTTPDLASVCDDVTALCTYTLTDEQRKAFKTGDYLWSIKVRDEKYKATSEDILFWIYNFDDDDDSAIPYNQTPVPNGVTSSMPVFGWWVEAEVEQHTLTVSGGDTFVVLTFDHADICSSAPTFEGYYVCSVDFSHLPEKGDTEVLPAGEYQWFVTTRLEEQEYVGTATSFTVGDEAPLSLPLFRAP